jgi:hypothetical protein
MSLTEKSWLPFCSRKKAMAEITQIRRDKAEDARRNELVRANERERHAIEEQKFQDIVLRIQGYIQPDGTRVMPSHSFAREEAIQSSGIRMEHAGDCLTFYTRVSKYFLNRLGTTLSPSDIRIVCDQAAARLAQELAEVMTSGKIEH